MFLCPRPVLKKLLTSVLALLLLLPGGAEARGEGRDITAQCVISTSGLRREWKKALDRRYKTFFARYNNREMEVQVRLPKGTREGGLYLCFYVEPEELRVYGDGEEEPFFTQSGPGYAHRYIPFEGRKSLRLVLRGAKKTGFALSEFFVTSGSTPPDFVQRWEPPLERADMLVLVAHPDDELLWMGGALPYYAVERGMDVAVAYMTCANPMRRSEMLNGLWTAGIRHYPYIGSFRDKRKQGIAKSIQLWGGMEKVEAYIVALYRRLKPQVVLSHDLNGEYGHPAHVITARGAAAALELAADPKAFIESAEAFGTWIVPKLYLHLYQENALEMDWGKPFASLGGVSPIEKTSEAFSMHRSQRARYSVETGGPYSSARFGLLRSLVGDDQDKNDFFENISIKHGVLSDAGEKKP